MGTSLKEIYKTFEFLLNDNSETTLQKNLLQKKIEEKQILFIDKLLDVHLKFENATESRIYGNIAVFYQKQTYVPYNSVDGGFCDKTWYDFVFDLNIKYDHYFIEDISKLNPGISLRTKGKITSLEVERKKNYFSDYKSTDSFHREIIDISKPFLSFKISLELKSFEKNVPFNYSLSYFKRELTHEQELTVLNESRQKEKNNMHRKEGCFIATACYGNYNAPEIILLRKYRDEKLMKIYIGRLFVSIYYMISPIFAKLISKSERLKYVIRKTFLNPLVTRLKQKNNNANH